jgi:hypothetical protein
MPTDNENRIFISHITEERGVAIRLQQLLRTTLGSDLEIFVASDATSIPSGEDWFNHIVLNLKRAKIALILLSEFSTSRPWINYEAGIAEGTGIKVMPIVIRGLSKGGVTFPLAHYQIRDIHDEDDIRGLLNDVGRLVNRNQAENLDIASFISEVRAIEASIPFLGIMLSPYIAHQTICFELLNTGNREVELQQIWAAVPSNITRDANEHYPSPPALEVQQSEIEGIPHLKKIYHVTNAPIERYWDKGNFERLPQYFQVNMSPLNLREMRIVLRGDLDENAQSEEIQFQVFARGINMPVQRIAIRDVPRRDTW